MSELTEFQQEVGEWGDETFNSKKKDRISCYLGIINHLIKEVKELYYALQQKFVCLGQPIITVEEESADCFFLLLYLAHLHGFDLLDEARKKMEINRKRSMDCMEFYKCETERKVEVEL